MAYTSQTSGIIDHALIKTMWNADRGNGVVSGMAASVTGASMVVTIASGVVVSNGIRYTYAGGTKTLSNGDATNKRMDAIIWDDSAQDIAVLAGVATAESSTQIKPPLTDLSDDNDFLLCMVYVGVAATVIASNQLFDRRIIVEGGTFDSTRALFHSNRRLVAEYSAQSVDTAGTPATVGVGFYAAFAAAGEIVTNISGEPIQRFSVAAASATTGVFSAAAGGGALACLSPNHSPRMLLRVQHPAASANVTYWDAGFWDSGSATAAGAYLRIVTTGNVFFVTRQGGSETTTDLGALSRTTILGYEIETADAGVTWVCRNQAGTVLATHTTNVPTAATALAYGVISTIATSQIPWGVAYARVEATFA